MMARIGNVGPEAISRSDRISNGLSSAMREHQMSMAPTRVDMLLGISSRPQSPPVFDTTEFNEEDMWGGEDGVVGGMSSSSSNGNLIASGGGGGGGPSSNAAALTTNPIPGLGVGDLKKYDVSFVGGSSTSNGNTVMTKEGGVSDVDPFRLLSNGRRWPASAQGREKDPGLSMAFHEVGRPRGFGASINRVSPAVPNASLSSAVANGGPGGRTTSRLIPSRGGDGLLYVSSPVGGDSRLLHQSAPVNVPDWSKILGAERNSYQNKSFVEDVVPENDEDEEERLPPHELVARDYARSQATTSMLEGAGRTLKGRDQSRVRNAVLRRTGFLTDQ